MGAVDYIDGFLEGHEPQGTRTVYRFFIVAFVILSLFSGVANVATLGKEGHRGYDVLTSVAILGLTGLTLNNIKWYRQDNQDPKHKRTTALLILMVLLLDVGACIAFRQTMTYVAPVPIVLPPETPAPTNNGTNVTLSSIVERYFQQHRDALNG